MKLSAQTGYNMRRLPKNVWWLLWDIVYRPDALPVTQAGGSNHWRTNEKWTVNDAGQPTSNSDSSMRSRWCSGTHCTDCVRRWQSIDRNSLTNCSLSGSISSGSNDTNWYSAFTPPAQCTDMFIALSLNISVKLQETWLIYLSKSKQVTVQTLLFKQVS